MPRPVASALTGLLIAALAALPALAGQPVSLLAGGKVARVDRVEWHTIPDAATAGAALQQGEVDLSLIHI